MFEPHNPLNQDSIRIRHHILVFDSGLGGLSVAQEIIRAQPQCRISYLADTAYFPYGTKSDAELIPRIEALIGQAITALAPDIIVIACNTASTLALAHLRGRFALPFVGVVPAIKPAALLTRSKTIALLATPATISRPYTAQLINDFANNCQVVRFGSSTLVTMAEASLCGTTPELAAIEQELAGLFTQPEGRSIDTVVLACTHFPLLVDALKQAAPHIHHWVDSGAAVARQVGVWLQKVPPSISSAGPVEFFSTQKYTQLHHVQVQKLLGRELLVDGRELFELIIPAATHRAIHGQN